MTVSATASGLGFLQGLVRHLGLESAVFVRASRGGTVQILAPRPERLELLQMAGKAWLVRAKADADSELSFIPVRSAEGQTLGVVVAERPAKAEWTARDAALLAYCIEAQAGMLDKNIVARPAPSPMASADATQPVSDASGTVQKRIDETPEARRSSPPAPAADSAFEADLRSAVGNGEMTLMFQPDFDLITGRMVAAEALVRWQHPRRGELEPAQFISLAERSGLIDSIGNWVIEEAIAAVAGWRAALPGVDFGVRINVSPVQMIGTGLVETITAAMAEHDVPGSSIGIELTEHEPPRNLTEVANILRELKALGIMSAIDDLATGYSTLSQLRALPVDMIKIDRSIVSGVDADPRARAILTAMIGLALNFGLDVIAEGVQTQPEIDTLLALGCTRAQGHLLSRPLSSDALLTALQSEHRVRPG